MSARASLDIRRTYQYDQLNRLRRFDEPAMYKEFSFDRYGNRAVTAFSPSNLEASWVWPNSLASYSAATNRISATPYNVYDAAGNSQDPSPYTQTWHAENRHITKDSPTSYYTSTAQFDGEGRMVQTSCLPGDRGRLVVYNAFGEHVADYAHH